MKIVLIFLVYQGISMLFLKRADKFRYDSSENASLFELLDKSRYRPEGERARIAAAIVSLGGGVLLLGYALFVWRG